MTQCGLPDDDVQALIRASQAARLCGDHSTASGQARRAAQRARAQGDRRLAARADGLLALDLWRLNEPAEALSVAKAALDDTDALGPPAWGIELRNTMTMLLAVEGRFIEALACATESVVRARALGEPSLMSWSLNRLAIVYEDLDERDKAIELFEAAGRQAQRGRDQDALFAAHINMAGALNALAEMADIDGDRTRAVELARRAVDGVRAAAACVGDNATRRLHCLSTEFVALELLGDHESLARIAGQYRALATELNLPRKVQRGRLMHAEAALARGDAETACELCEQLLCGALEIDPSLKNRSLTVAYEAYKAAGRPERALHTLEQLWRLDRQDARTRIQAHARALLRDAEIERARQEALNLRQQAADLDAKAAAAERESLQDPLTGIANRRALDQRLLAATTDGEAGGPWVAVIDIDHFKRVNDQHGHETGDKVLRQVAALLAKGIRGQDFVARSGGEEFVVLLAVGSGDLAGDVCKRLLRSVQDHDWRAVLPDGGVTVSIGLAQASAPGGVPEALRRADAALYDAKHGGRNRICLR
jgi:diguanylate cyclase (GGDEF)-like protein